MTSLSLSVFHIIFWKRLTKLATLDLLEQRDMHYSWIFFCFPWLTDYTLCFECLAQLTTLKSRAIIRGSWGGVLEIREYFGIIPVTNEYWKITARAFYISFFVFAKASDIFHPNTDYTICTWCSNRPTELWVYAKWRRQSLLTQSFWITPSSDEIRRT